MRNSIESFSVEDPFNLWLEGMNLDKQKEFSSASTVFKKSATAFFEAGSANSSLAKPYYEYSTVMEAFSRVERGRNFLASKQFELAITPFSETSEILRSTIHFGFLAPFISGCGTAETSDSIEERNEESFQGYKNAIAFFEQSKLALSFRDEIHPVLSLADTYIRYCITEALKIESILNQKSGDQEGSADKMRRAEFVRKEFEFLAKRNGVPLDSFVYLPINDYIRATTGSYVVVYPNGNEIILFNLGSHSAKVLSFAELHMVEKILTPKNSLVFDGSKINKGKVRVQYEDLETGKQFNEGCFLSI